MRIINFLQERQTLVGALKEWQTLVGALIPVLVAIIVEPIRRYYKRKKEYKDNLRKIEIHTVQAMNDVFEIFKEWISFIRIMRNEIKKNNQIGILIINKPNVASISWKKDLVETETKDIILDNSLINLDRWIRNFNLINNQISIYDELQENFKSSLLNPKLSLEERVNIYDRYKEEIIKYLNFIESHIYESTRNGVEIITIVREAAKLNHEKSKVPQKRRQKYKEISKISVDNFALFQEEISRFFKKDFIKNIVFFVEEAKKIEKEDTILNLFKLEDSEKRLFKDIVNTKKRINKK